MSWKQSNTYRSGRYDRYNASGDASEEEWKPQQFVSSRSKRAQIANVRAEDLMDDEDFGTVYSVGKTLTTKEEYRNTRPTGDAVLDTIAAPQERIGMQLLRRMGWYEGYDNNSSDNGRQKRKEVSGEGMPELIIPIGKTDTYGIGYKEDINGSKGLTQRKSGLKSGMSSSLYDAEDNDVFGADSMADYDTTLHTTEQHEDDDIYIPQQSKHHTTIEDFVKSTTCSLPLQSFPDPPIPPNFNYIYDYNPVIQVHQDVMSLNSYRNRIDDTLKEQQKKKHDKQIAEIRAKYAPDDQNTSTIAAPMTNSKVLSSEMLAKTFHMSTTTLNSDDTNKPHKDYKEEEGLITHTQNHSTKGKGKEDKLRDIVRTEELWSPSSLLCRRFNVDPPFHVEEETNRASQHSLRSAALDHKVQELLRSASVMVPVIEKKKIVNNDHDNNNNEQDENMYKKPNISLFQMIFEDNKTNKNKSSSSSSSSSISSNISRDNKDMNRNNNTDVEGKHIFKKSNERKHIYRRNRTTKNYPIIKKNGPIITKNGPVVKKNEPIMEIKKEKPIQKPQIMLDLTSEKSKLAIISRKPPVHVVDLVSGGDKEHAVHIDDPVTLSNDVLERLKSNFLEKRKEKKDKKKTKKKDKKKDKKNKKKKKSHKDSM